MATKGVSGLVRTAMVVCLTGVATVIQPAGAADTSIDEQGQTREDDTTVEELKLARAWIPSTQRLRFGAEPLGYIRDAAASAAADVKVNADVDANAGANANCAVTEKEATALVIAMTWPEVSPSGAPPSPMTLSRYDNQPSLADPAGRAPGLWFHPGIGMWQLDSAGLGTGFTAAEAIDAQYAAEQLAPVIVGKYCASRADGATAAEARAFAWRDWIACRRGACEDIYHRVLGDGVTAVPDVSRYGGADVRTCRYRGASYECLYVDTGLAQGSAWWTVPAGGRSPVAAPFYVLRIDDDDAPEELRYWLAEDSGADADVQAVRPLGADARHDLTWSTGPGLCDETAARGTC